MAEHARATDNDAGKAASTGERKSRELARGHYENFEIAAFILPKRLRQDLYNVYAFLRLADDLADESPDESEAQNVLSDWGKSLETANDNDVSDPIISALRSTIRRHRLSLEPFRRLLYAFRMDLTTKRWNSWDDLKHYTRHSADPVGRIVLELFDHHDPDFFALSDKICTALQLVNHWQDVREDWDRGRVYIPRDDMRRFGVNEEDIALRLVTDRFRKLMTFEVERARSLFLAGLPLLKMVNRRLELQLALYWGGGMRALRAIERVDYDVLNRSAGLTAGDKRWVVFSALKRWILPFK